MTRIGVVLSGCGFLDGTEIHEAVLTLLHLDQRDVEVVAMAPRGPQRHVVDHLTGNAVDGEARDILVESARLVRGRIVELATVDPAKLDGLILPGGFGAAKNLSDFAFRGAAASVHPDLRKLLQAVHARQRPIGALCIAPALLAVVLGHAAPQLTIGNDAATAAALRSCGASHTDCAVTDCLVDRRLRLVTTPAYMYDARIHAVSLGIGKLVDAVLALANESA
jgi:enhancing lycopene biosynthesis protein 2